MTFSSALKAVAPPSAQSSLSFLLSGMSSVRPQGHLYLKALHTCLCSFASLSFSCIPPQVPNCYLLPRVIKLTQKVSSTKEKEIVYPLRKIIVYLNYFGFMPPEDEENL